MSFDHFLHICGDAYQIFVHYGVQINEKLET